MAHQRQAATAPDEDAVLLGRARQGDASAFDALVSRYERRIYTLARRIVGQAQDAEDVTQQTFLNALEALDGFRGEAKVSTWLFRIAVNASLKLLRKRRGLPTVSLDALLEPDERTGAIPHPEVIAEWRATPVALAQRRETARHLEAALKTLDAGHRLVFLLRDVEGFSVRETAKLTGLSESNVRVRLLRARLKLRERLTEAFGDPATRLRPQHGGHRLARVTSRAPADQN